MESKNNTKFVFKVVSLGGFFQLLKDEKNYLNRPIIQVDDKRKKWGNEYVVFDTANYDLLVEENLKETDGICFVGSFNIDQAKKKYIRLLKNLGIPVHAPDYYIITFEHRGDRFDKELDLIKADRNSYSSIFSSAFHYHEEEDEYECQTILVLQHSDRIIVNGHEHMFSAKTQALICNSAEFTK